MLMNNMKSHNLKPITVKRGIFTGMVFYCISQHSRLIGELNTISVTNTV